MKETTGSLTNATVAVDANLDRQGLIVSNNSDTVMTYRPIGTATASVGIAIPANTQLTLTTKGLITGAGTVFCAGTGKVYAIYEW